MTCDERHAERSPPSVEGSKEEPDESPSRSVARAPMTGPVCLLKAEQSGHSPRLRL